MWSLKGGKAEERQKKASETWTFEKQSAYFTSLQKVGLLGEQIPLSFTYVHEILKTHAILGFLWKVQLCSPNHTWFCFSGTLCNCVLVLNRVAWGSSWLQMWQICRCGKCRSDTVFIGVTVICQEIWAQLTAVFIDSPQKVLVLSLFLHWVATHNWCGCAEDVDATRKRDICIGVGRAAFCSSVMTFMRCLASSACLLCAPVQMQQGVSARYLQKVMWNCRAGGIFHSVLQSFGGTKKKKSECLSCESMLLK